MNSAYHGLERFATDRGLRPHFVLHAPAKKPLRKGWRETPETADMAAAHADRGGLVGLIPASLGLVAVDADQGGLEAVEAVKSLLGVPLDSIPSKTEGRFHLWYRSLSTKKPPYQWEIEGKGSGEVLYATRSAILYHPARLVEALRGYDQAEAIDADKLPKLKRGSKAEGRNNRLYREQKDAARSADQLAAQERALSAGLPLHEVEATTRSAEAAAKEPQGSGFTAAPDPGAGIFFDADHNGLAAALERAQLELTREVRTENILIRHVHHETPASKVFYDIVVSGRSEGMEIEERPPDGWLPLDSFIDARLRTYIADSFLTPAGRKLKFTLRDWNTAIFSLTLDKRYDAVKFWMDNLPPWDEEKRLSKLFIQTLDAADTELNRLTARCLLIAAVRRAYEPGEKHDLLPILIGPQGGGKSTFCRYLIPPDRQNGTGAWFSDSVGLGEPTQKQVEGTGPALIVEYSEVAGLSAAKREQLKAYLSRQSDRYRPPYFTAAVSIPRQWVGIGTANDTGQGILPADSTGYRRFVSISVGTPGPQGVRQYLNNDRNQLWAEAIAAYRAGEPHWLPDHLSEEQEATNLIYARANEVLEDKVSVLTKKHAGGGLASLASLMIEAGLVTSAVAASQDVELQRAVARELRKSGWDRRKATIDGNRLNMWSPPSERICSICDLPKQPLLDPKDGRGLICNDCAGNGDDDGGTPLGAALSTSLEFQADQDRDLHFQWTTAGNLFGEPEPALVSQRQVGLRSLLTAVRANPRIADIPEEQLAVYGGPTALARTIGDAIGMVDKARWVEIEGSLDWPAFLLNVRGRAISLIEKEPDRRQTEKEAMVGMLQQPRLLPSPLAGH